jgi:RNA polymerase sigma-70 factor (ECF subfamily)
MTATGDDYETFLGHYARSQSRLQAFIRALVPDPTHADDVFQATSLALWRSFATFRREADFTAWAIGVARHQVLMHWRTRRRDRHVFSEALLADLADTAVTMLDEAEARQRALDACVETLPERQRDLIRRFYGADESAATIAAAWNRTVHAVYKALKVMRRGLLECVERRLVLLTDASRPAT